MSERLSAAEARLEDLARAVAGLEARIAALEAHIAGQPPATVVAPVLTSGEHTAAPAGHGTTGESGLRLPALGRAVLVLAGAFLLRALTDGGIVAGHFGVVLGLAYAVFIFYLTDRAARAGQRPSAGLYGVAAVLVTYSFIWETTTKLELLRPASAVIVTTLVTTLGLGVTVRHHLRAVAWTVIGAALATTTALCWTSTVPTLFAALIVALGVTTVWLGYLRGWTGPRWLAAALANSLVMLLVLLAIRGGEPLAGRPAPSPGAVFPLALALAAAYLVSFFAYTLTGRREAGVFEILQSLGCLCAGYLGAVLVQKSTGGSVVALGWLAVIVGVASYAVAFTFVRRRQGRRLNFFYFAWLGILLVMTGTALVLPVRWLPYLWSVLGVVAAVAGGRFDRWTLRLHSAAYLIGATTATGLPAAVFDAFIAPAAATWHRLRAPGLTVWLVACLSYLLLVVTQRQRALSAWRRLPRFLLAGLVLAGLGGLLVTALTTWLVTLFAGSEQAVVAAVRTAVLAGTIIVLAALTPYSDLAELSWFVNPLLVVTGLKLITEDLRAGTPLSLFLGFACFGIALIVAPRLRRRGAATAATDGEPANGAATDSP